MSIPEEMIPAAKPSGPCRGLADVLREIASEQRARGFPGRSAADIQAELDAQAEEDAERDRELDAARSITPAATEQAE